MKWNSYVSAIWLLGYSCDLHLLAGELIFILLFNSLLKIEMYEKKNVRTRQAMQKMAKKPLQPDCIEFLLQINTFSLRQQNTKRKTLVKSTICLKSFWNEPWCLYQYNKLSIRNKIKTKETEQFLTIQLNNWRKKLVRFFGLTILKFGLRVSLICFIMCHALKAPICSLLVS